MVACVLIPGFELRAALRARPNALLPAALAPAEGEEPLLGPVTAGAGGQGGQAGHANGGGARNVPGARPRRPGSVRSRAGLEEILRRLEDCGIAVESADLGCVYFETRGVERLYGGVEAALSRALAAVGSAWDPRAGAAGRRFAALAAANVARPGQVLIVADDRTREFLAPLPLDLLPLAEQRRRELEELGVRKVGELAGLPGGAVAERLGPDGRRAWSLARGRDRGRVRGRRAPAEIVETLEFPEAIGNELTLRRALAVLVDRLLSRSERGERFLRKVALSATSSAVESWRRPAPLREPFADAGRLRTALGPKLAELPAPVLKLKLEALELTESGGQQLALVRPEDDELQGMLREGLRQVKASTGEGGVCTVVEVAPGRAFPSNARYWSQR